ncbi:GNAT family N-acetyltransferase [Streptosporangium vulgare]|uniref:GNAT family N-acetyltransferase n=1 Tax=Streptosporangium vulgare TaxID=46190 RepID=UPI0031CF0D6A
MPFLPRPHEIPAGVEHERFHIRPITIHDAVRDFDAVMSSAARLRERFPLWGWPPGDMTLEGQPDRPGLAPEGGPAAQVVQLRGGESRRVPPARVRLRRPSGEARGRRGRVVLGTRRRGGHRSGGGAGAVVRAWLDEAWPYSSVRWPGRDVSWEEWALLPDVLPAGG